MVSTHHDSNYHNDTLNCLYLALVELMKTKPFQDITKIEIIRKAGVSHMSFYRYYKTKQDILFRRLNGYLETLEKTFLSSEDIDRHKFWTLFYQFYQQDPVILYLIEAGFIKDCIHTVYRFFIKNYECIYHAKCPDEFDEMRILFESGGVLGLVMFLQKYGNFDCEVLATNTLRFIDSLAEIQPDTLKNGPKLGKYAAGKIQEE